MVYKVNKLAIIFLKIDCEYDYHSVGYNHQTDDLFAIRPREYHFMKFLDDKGPLDENALLEYRGQGIENTSDCKAILASLIDKNLIVKYGS